MRVLTKEVLTVAQPWGALYHLVKLDALQPDQRVDDQRPATRWDATPISAQAPACTLASSVQTHRLTHANAPLILLQLVAARAPCHELKKLSLHHQPASLILITGVHLYVEQVDMRADHYLITI